jgi:TrkA domain protein
MASTVEHIELPGVGVRSVFSTSAGLQVGVLAHNSGEKDLLVYAKDDPDRCADVMKLDAAEAQVMADLLGMAPLGSVADRLLIGGVVVSWVEVGSDWWIEARDVADIGPKLTCLAVVRADAVVAPATVGTIVAGDVLIVAGRAADVDRAGAVLESGP